MVFTLGMRIAALIFGGIPRLNLHFPLWEGCGRIPQGDTYLEPVCASRQANRSMCACVFLSVVFLFPPKKWPNISGVAELLDKLHMDFRPTNQGIDVFCNIPWGWLSLGNYHEQQMGIIFLLNMSSLVCNWIGVWAVCQDHVLDKSSLLPHWDVPGT